MKSLKFYKLLSLVLVIVNLAILTFFFLTRPPHPPKPGEIMLSSEIGLEGKDKTFVDQLETDHHKKKRSLMKRNFELHKQLYAQLSDSSASTELMLKINSNLKEIEKMTFDFFSEVSSICDGEERKKLDEIITKSLRRITGQGPGPK